MQRKQISDGGHVDEAQVTGVRLVVSCGDTSALLRYGPETFGQIPLLVELLVKLQGCLAALQWRNDRLRSQSGDLSTNAVTVVSLVGDDGLGSMIAQQRTGMSGVRFLASGQLQFHGDA